MKFKKLFSFSLYVGSLALNAATAFGQGIAIDPSSTPITPATDAATFLERLPMLRASARGGAGNGGGTLRAEFSHAGLIGQQILNLQHSITAQENARLTEAMAKTDIYGVEFNLCVDNLSTCTDAVAFAAKNYPELGVILVDVRKGNHGRWHTDTFRERRQLATHEYAGIAGIEKGNFHVTAPIDDERVFNEYVSLEERKAYFRLLNDLYFLLPPTSNAVMAGDWGKRTVIRPDSFEYTRTGEKLMRGANYLLSIALNPFRKNSEWEIRNGSPANRERPRNALEATVLDYTNAYQTDIGGGTVGKSTVFPCFCGGGFVQDGELKCGLTNDRKFATRWKGKVERTYAPTFHTASLKHGDSIGNFTCKALGDDEIICRSVRLDKASFINAFYYVYEYVFYQRVKIEDDGRITRPMRVTTD